MHHFQAKELTAKQNYKFLTGSILPRPIAWLVTMDTETGIVNAAPFSFFNPVAKKPPLVSLSVERKDGEIKDSARNLIANGEAVIHLINDDLLQKMNLTSASLPPHQSELELIDVSLIPSQSVKVPAIAEAKIRMETAVYQYIPVRNSAEEPVSDLFILEVSDFYFDEEIFDADTQHVLAEKFAPVARLAGNQYGHLSDITEVKRPE